MIKKAYYKGLFKVEEVEILAEQEIVVAFSDTSLYDYEYLIRFKSGKTKFVKENKLSFREEMAA